MKKILVLLLALMMVLAFTGCAGADEFEADLSDLPTIEGADFEELIDDFAEDSFNVIELKSGEKEKPMKADYTLSRGGKCYSSDESVATVSDSGTIKAKGRGTCYIALVGDESTFGREIMVYKVVVDPTLSLRLSGALSGDTGDLSIVLGIVFALIPIGMIVTVAVIITKIIRSNRAKKTDFSMPVTQEPGNAIHNRVSVTNTGVTPGKVCLNCGQKAEGAYCPYCGTKMN